MIAIDFVHLQGDVRRLTSAAFSPAFDVVPRQTQTLAGVYRDACVALQSVFLVVVTVEYGLLSAIPMTNDEALG